ncbi:uncharacterized protein LOC126964596 [Leptidea sinapis]|uniref:uncharacterized protein LOC126964596 n=1 Tax=Leptidea sinapis TaxID=189913 RepID=UPI0021C4C338|nr:uncharacterized protein LOC126964596 [Leptidea sinapis]
MQVRALGDQRPATTYWPRGQQKHRDSTRGQLAAATNEIHHLRSVCAHLSQRPHVFCEYRMFDTERFIIEIQNREALWNQSSDDYSNKNLKRQLWLELTDIFGGENLEEKEKGELGLSLQMKWKNIRDTFTRELRRLKGAKSGSAAKRKSAYIYFDQLQFLMPTLEINETSASLSETTPEENDNQTNELTDTPENTRKKQRKILTAKTALHDKWISLQQC